MEKKLSDLKQNLSISNQRGKVSKIYTSNIERKVSPKKKEFFEKKEEKRSIKDILDE